MSGTKDVDNAVGVGDLDGPHDLVEPRSFAASPCSEDLEMSALLVRWKDRILHRAALNIDNHMINGPVEDFTEEQKGFERGLRKAVDEVCKLMADPSYWSRSPQNDQADRLEASNENMP